MSREPYFVFVLANKADQVLVIAHTGIAFHAMVATRAALDPAWQDLRILHQFPTTSRDAPKLVNLMSKKFGAITPVRGELWAVNVESLEVSGPHSNRGLAREIGICDRTAYRNQCLGQLLAGDWHVLTRESAESLKSSRSDARAI